MHIDDSVRDWYGLLFGCRDIRRADAHMRCGKR